MAGLAQTRMRTAGKMADLPMALAGRFTDHHALTCRLHLDRIKIFDEAVSGLDGHIAPLVARYAREAELLKTLPGFGDVIAAGWLGAIGRHRRTAPALPAANGTGASPDRHGSLIRSRLCSPPGRAGQGRSLRSRRHGDGASATLDSPALPGGFRQLSDEAPLRLS